MSTQLPPDVDDGETVSAERLERRLRQCGVAVAERELRTALSALDDLTPAQRRTVAHMAGRIAVGVLEPAREAAGEEERTVARLFDPERLRD